MEKTTNESKLWVLIGEALFVQSIIETNMVRRMKMFNHVMELVFGMILQKNGTMINRKLTNHDTNPLESLENYR